ncbi:MAG: FAD-binding oxidoreductase [Alphaproteobacteria bacterium]|nr:MAG: FAD-binding oxidoreductase [Alphaproteobacteria bacterium]
MSYDAIVVGAGISGAATAYHVAKGGAKTLLLERGEPASGGTGKSAAIIRQSYSTPLLVRLARASITMFENAKNELGRDAGFVQDGYCFVVSREMVDGAKKNVAMQKSLGIVNEWSEGPGFPQHLSEIDPDGIAGVVYEPHGGYADPVQATEAYVEAFKTAGGEFRPRTPVRRLLREGDRITGVELDSGEAKANLVVNAAGPWAKPLAESAGLDLPLRCVREQDTVWQIPSGRKIPKASISMGVDATYFRPLGQGRFIIGRGFPKDYFDVDPYNYKTSADADFISDVQTRVERRFPSFAGMKLIEAYAALYDVTPDWYPFVGPRSGLAGYADFCGGSGHGFKIAPAIGRELADWLLTGKVADDFRQFSHDRIAAGNLFVQSFGGNRG